jgi:hypothetical protein
MLGTVCIGDAINWDHPLNRGLIGRWKALPDQQRGNLFRDLLMRNPLTLTNGPLWVGGKGRPGGYGSLLFDGSNDHATATVGANLKPARLSCGAWFRIPSGAVSGGILCHGGGGYRLYVGTIGAGGTSANDKLSLSVYNGSAFGTATSANSVEDSLWHFGLGTFDGSNVRLYLDGVLQATTALTGSMTSLGNNFTLGADQGGSTARFTGEIDDGMVFNYALSDSQVVELFKATKSELDPTLNWTFPLWYAAEQAAVAGGKVPWHLFLGMGA